MAANRRGLNWVTQIKYDTRIERKYGVSFNAIKWKREFYQPTLAKLNRQIKKYPVGSPESRAAERLLRVLGRYLFRELPDHETDEIIELFKLASEDPIRAFGLDEEARAFEPQLLELTESWGDIVQSYPNCFRKSKYFKPLLGRIERHIDLKEKYIDFESARFSSARGREHGMGFVNIPGIPELVPGKGTPTQAFVTLHQMRLAGVERGSLRTATTSPILNQLTQLELAHAPAIRKWRAENPRGAKVPAALIAQEILNTNSGRYIETVLIQSGHRIKKIIVHQSESPDSKLELSAKKYHFTKRLAPLLEDMREDDRWPNGFSLKFQLEPWN